MVSSLVVANNVISGGGLTNQPAGAVYSTNPEYAGGASGIFADADSQDYWPAQNSPLIGAADATHVPERDFNGHVRLPPFDVGAYESDGLSVNPGWAIQDGFKGDSSDTVSLNPPTDLTAE